METEAVIRKKNHSLLISLAALVMGMLLLSYASVPLYRIFCRVTGFGGTINTEAKAPPAHPLARIVHVTFNTDVDRDLPWKFKALQPSISLHVGERKLVFFEATNESSEPVTGIAAYNVTPEKLGPYIDKIKCFCFDKQMIKPGETVRFPVSFFVDPDMINDRDLDDIDTMTLSYTFFRATEP
ncbi:MAG: cytochrome c oxidase assembly protein [Rickettsiales bacterium]